MTAVGGQTRGLGPWADEGGPTCRRVETPVVPLGRTGGPQGGDVAFTIFLMVEIKEKCPAAGHWNPSPRRLR
jgi:hypothetical protein